VGHGVASLPRDAAKSLIDIKSGHTPACFTAPFANHQEAEMSTERIEDEVPEEPVPAMQMLLDNPFLLLFLGIAMPTVLYIVWGVMEIVSLPIAK
jgi:hypothetical protein